MSNFGNNYNKTEIELKVSLLEKENVELRGQLIYKLLIMKQLKTNSKITYSLLMLLLHQSRPMITSTTVMTIITTVITITTTAITVKTRTMATRATKITKLEILRRTIIALMKRHFTTKS